MKISGYPTALAVSALIAAALLLADRPLGRGEGNAVQAAATATASFPIAADISGPELPDDAVARRRAIEDVLPLMRSLEARGDTLRLVRLARSVLMVWSELDSLHPGALRDERLRQRVEYWAGSPPAEGRVRRVDASGF